MNDEHASSNSHHEQVQKITNLRNGGIVNNHMEEKRTEQIRPTEKPNQAKGKEVISEVQPLTFLRQTINPKLHFLNISKSLLGMRMNNLTSSMLHTIRRSLIQSLEVSFEGSN